MKNMDIGSKHNSNNFKPPKNYFVRQLNSFRYAGHGIILIFSDYNFVIHIPAGIIVCLTAWWLDVSPTQWLFLVSAIFSVWVSEAINIAIENLCNFVHPTYHLAIGHIKDISSGAVLLSTIYATIVGIMIFYPYIYRYFQ